MKGELRVFGIRHHGPGSARSLVAALEAFAPDAVLIEGPPEAETALPLAAHPELVPPVALLMYVPDEPRRAVFYPFAEFSPEWNAIRYALDKGTTLRLIDLPVGHTLAQEEGESEKEDTLREDPLRLVAEAAGYSDGERWWEHMIEQRQGATELFHAIQGLMTALREEVGERLDPNEARREAHMRLSIRRARDEGHARIAVVCGAWHVPALVREVPAAEDQALLKGLPKAKVAATWVPWTYDRLAAESGYGAGMVSPAYYEHLWRSRPETVTSGWVLKAARLLREEDLDASPASAIEAVRLAEALAAVRERSVPGLDELREAAQSVLGGGAEAPMRLIERRLIVGEALGRVPEDTPSLPLQADLAAQQKRLRLSPEGAPRLLDLDLRNDTDLARSHLLHRLLLLGVAWGEPQGVRGKSGTFHEHWTLQWRPELSLSVVEASRWGNTIESAATARATDEARAATELPRLTALADSVLTASLPEAVGPVMARLRDAAAVAGDVGEMLDALPPLASVLRYGSVRRTDTGLVGSVFDSLFVRVCVGLPVACASLDDEAAGAMAGRLTAAQGVVSLLEHAEREALWREALRSVADLAGVHGLVAGKACRLLLDLAAMDREEVARRLAHAASPATAPPAVAAWIEGFLGGSGLVLLHDESLWSLIDGWIASLKPEAFDEVLPLLRRTFATFPRPERRQMGERARDGLRSSSSQETEIDEERAARPLPLLRRMLGLEVGA